MLLLTTSVLAARPSTKFSVISTDNDLPIGVTDLKIKVWSTEKSGRGSIRYDTDGWRVDYKLKQYSRVENVACYDYKGRMYNRELKERRILAGKLCIDYHGSYIDLGAFRFEVENRR